MSVAELEGWEICILMAGKLEIGSFKMSWGQKAFGPGEGYTYDLKGTAVDPTNWGLTDNFTDEVVTERRAGGLATVYICWNVRARTVASLPVNVMIEEKGNKRVVTDHSVYYPLAHEPNNYMSSANMFLTSMIHSDSYGNSVIGINRDSRGRPYRFDLLCPGEWDVVKQDGQAFYRINGETYSASEVLHFRWFSWDGLCGVSPIRQNQMTMGKGFRQARYSAQALGDRPPGHMSYEGNMDATQRAMNQEAWRKDRHNGRVPILSGKWTYQSHLIPPGDAEYIQTEDMTDEKIYGIYQLPPVFAQNYRRATWSNAEQSDLIYAKHTVTNIVRVLEQECNMKLFTRKEKANMFVKFNMNGLLRGDLKARAEFYTAMKGVSAINGNEIRDLEDKNPYKDGDIFTTQVQNIPIDQLRKFYESQVLPKEDPNGQSNGQVNGKHFEFVN